jgi:hypothetical protein
MGQMTRPLAPDDVCERHRRQHRTARECRGRLAHIAVKVEKRSNDVPPAVFDRISQPQRGRQPRTLGKCLNRYELVLDYGTGRGPDAGRSHRFLWLGPDYENRCDRCDGEARRRKARRERAQRSEPRERNRAVEAAQESVQGSPRGEAPRIEISYATRRPEPCACPCAQVQTTQLLQL